MKQPPCDQNEDDGTPCPSWAIVGYDTCLAHWMPGEGPKRLHQPAYTGPYQEGRFKLDRPVSDEPAASSPAQPYTSVPPITQSVPDEHPIAADVRARLLAAARAELTPEPETVQTPDENESPVDNEEPDLPDIIARLLTEESAATLDAEWDRIRNDALTNIDTMAVEPAPNPPSRRGWFKIFRRIA